MEASFYPYLGALCWIGMLLMLGTLIRAKVPLFQKLLFPSSLIGGLIGFVLINLDLVGMPTSTGWKDITPNIFSMITFHLFAFGFVGIGLLQTKKPASGKVVMRGALWIALVFGMTFSVQALIGKGVFVACGRDAGAAFRPHGNFRFRAKRLDKQRVGNDAYIRAHADKFRARKTILPDKFRQFRTAERGFVEHGIALFGKALGDLPAIASAQAVFDGQVLPLLRGKVILPVRIAREGDRFAAFAGLCDARADGGQNILRLLCSQRAADKIVLHIHHDQQIFSAHSSSSRNFL